MVTFGYYQPSIPYKKGRFAMQDLWTPFIKSNRVDDGLIVANGERKESYYHENARKR